MLFHKGEYFLKDIRLKIDGKCSRLNLGVCTDKIATLCFKLSLNFLSRKRRKTYFPALGKQMCIGLKNHP